MNKVFYKIALAALTVFVGASAAMAVPAKPGIRTVKNADGSELRVKVFGDENFHQYFTEDGYPLIRTESGFNYCEFDAAGRRVDTGIKAVNVSKRDASAKEYLSSVDLTMVESRINMSIAASPRRVINNSVQGRKRSAASDGSVTKPPYPMGQGLFPGSSFPAYGRQKAIVILVEYKDIKFRKSYSVDAKDYFSRMLNEDNFSDLGATGSAAQFFRENSNYAFIPEFDVYGPITLKNNRSYYGGNDYSGNDEHPEDMIIEACQQLDDVVDFREYDRNGDGVVDNVFVFYAGVGEASSNIDDSVWPHSWELSSSDYGELVVDGVRVNTYGCTNEWTSDGRPDGVGTFVHEFSHVMGLPDLYATTYSSAFTPGNWSALDYGPYNNSGMTPPNYSVFERYALGWIKPVEINSAMTASMPSIDKNVAGIIRTDKGNEFFLVENRQQTGWDKYIPGHGMLVWHVDYNSTVWTNNVVNNSTNHQYVDLVEADNTKNESSRTGDAFPGSSQVTSFTSTTNPAMKTWAGTSVNYPITNIVEKNGLITFDVLGGKALPTPPTGESLSPKVANITDMSVDLSWTGNADFEYLVNVYSYDDKNMIVYADGCKDLNVGNSTSYKVTGLTPETKYCFTITATNGWESGAESIEQVFMTGRMGINRYAPVALEASDVTTESFVANWESLQDATDYLLSVYEFKDGEPYEVNCDFVDGLKHLPEGWTTTATNTYSASSNVGEEAPSLRVANGQNLTIGSYEDYISYLSFWYRGVNTTEGDLLKVNAVVNGKQVLIDQIVVETTDGGVTKTYNEIPANAEKIIIEFVRKGSKGNLALDDIVVKHGHIQIPSFLEGYSSKEVGNVTNATVEGLKPGHAYYYYVVATDGELQSLKSNEIEVRTEGSRVIGINSDADRCIIVDGRVVTVGGEELIVVYDATGRKVVSGCGMVLIPDAGLYLVNVAELNATIKVIVK